MPSSTSAGKDYIKKIINKMITDESDRILDLGCGRGTYSRLIEKKCYRVGVDAVDYKERFSLDDWYDDFYVKDIRDTDFLRSLGKFKLSIAGDVLEHLTPEDARKVLDVMKDISDICIVALPYIYEQKGYKKGDWEFHEQSDLTRKVIKQRYPELILLKEYTRKSEPWNGRPFYGYYVWAKGL